MHITPSWRIAVGLLSTFDNHWEHGIHCVAHDSLWRTGIAFVLRCSTPLLLSFSGSAAVLNHCVCNRTASHFTPLLGRQRRCISCCLPMTGSLRPPWFKAYKNFGSENTILLRDSNIRLDGKNSRNSREPRLILDSFSMTDAWKESAQQGAGYTWQNPNRKQQSRLDYY